MKPPASTQSPYSRGDAARLLRDARASSGDLRAEMAGWAYLAMPDRMPARLLYARTLIEQDELDQARALIVQSLLQAPTHPALTLLRADLLFREGSLEQAQSEIGLAVRVRPWHVATRELAARIASALGNHELAVDHYKAALRRRPRPGLHEQLVTAMLRSGDLTGAEQLSRRLDVRSDLLEARMLRARGRVLDALERLEQALAGCPGEAAEPLVIELIDIAESGSDTARLRSALRRVGPAQPRASLRAAESWLQLGEPLRSARLLRPLLGGRHRLAALSILLVAATLAGRTGLAARVRNRLGSRASTRRMAACWRRGLTGRIIRAQTSAESAGADPSTSLLHPLLERAIEVFEETLTFGDTVPAPERAEIARLRQSCQAVLG